MLSRPTTEQILLDCRKELLSTIDGALTDAPAKIAVQMMENVLRNCAERAAHEIAWMREEGEAAVAYAEHVAASVDDRDAVRSALAAYRSGRSESLHLDDVCATYDLASGCLGVAIEAAMAAGDDELTAAGRALLDARLEHETAIMGEWAFVGRA